MHVLTFTNLYEDLRARLRFLASPRDRRAERAAKADARTPSDWLDVSHAYFGVGALQVREEILALLEMAAGNSTRVVCEIGAYDAGTSLLMSRAVPGVEALVVVDLFVKNRWRLRQGVPSGQTIHVVDGDSRHPRTVARVRRKLGGRKIDFLLIDGDHSFAGVMQDFLTYRHFVRPGGLIAFHDIVPVRTPGSELSAGDVP
ncbi:MAG TPA: class I SAM-dependent methyltransferase, partial [Thermoleophilaceae bacterium]